MRYFEPPPTVSNISSLASSAKAAPRNMVRHPADGVTIMEGSQGKFQHELKELHLRIFQSLPVLPTTVRLADWLLLAL